MKRFTLVFALFVCMMDIAMHAQTLVWTGTWSSTTAYVAGDTVSYLGGTYIAIASNTNVAPPTNSADWSILAQPGATVAVGTTVTGAPLTSAGVVNTGTAKNAVLNFTIPQGYVTGGGGGIPYPAYAGVAVYSGANSWSQPSYTNIVSLWANGSCNGYLYYNGTCTASTGGLPVNNPSFTGNLAGPSANIGALTVTSCTGCGGSSGTSPQVFGAPPFLGFATTYGGANTAGITASNGVFDFGNGTAGDASGTVDAATLTATTSVTTPVLNGVTDAAQLPGADIGAKINSFGPNGTLFIPDGTYNFSTPISITLQGGDYLHIICSSRATILNYTGTGDAIYQTTPAGNGNTQLEIDNCTLIGTSAATNGIHFFYAQNPLLINNSISGFPGSPLLGQGVIDGVYIKNDFSGGTPVHLEPDTTHNFASNANHFYGGSMTYGTTTNFWDEGNSSSYGGDTGNTLDGVTMEMNVNLPQFIVEGTWNDAIQNGYLEYISFSTSTANLYNGVVGNYAGSGYGSNLTYNAANFKFSDNYLITPKAGATFTTASLLMETTSGVNVQNLTDVGAPTYAVVFNASSANGGATVGPSGVGWQNAAYQNPPSDASLWTYGGQPTSTSGWSGSANGRLYNAITAQTINATTSVTTPLLTGQVSGSSTIASSATPALSATAPVNYNVLTANVTSWTLGNGTVDGQQTIIEFCQNATGGFTVAGGPTTVRGFMTIPASEAANKCNVQTFAWSVGQTAWLATGPGVVGE